MIYILYQEAVSSSLLSKMPEVTDDNSLSTCINPFPTDTFWTLPIPKTLQTTIFNLVEMAESSPKRVENTVGKEEIARYEQFLLFPQCFQKTFTADT